MNKKLLLLKNFPPSILETTWKEMPLVNPGKLVRISEIIKEEPYTLFTYKDSGVLIDKLIDDGGTIEDFRAIDYASYFSSIIEDKVYTVKANVLYIFNVGTELSNSTAFSDKVLHKLVQFNKDLGNTTIIVSDYYNFSTFTTKYSMTAQLVDSGMQVLK